MSIKLLDKLRSQKWTSDYKDGVAELKRLLKRQPALEKPPLVKTSSGKGLVVRFTKHQREDAEAISNDIAEDVDGGWSRKQLMQAVAYYADLSADAWQHNMLEQGKLSVVAVDCLRSLETVRAVCQRERLRLAAADLDGHLNAIEGCADDCVRWLQQAIKERL